jgi:type II secretory pathway component GspD/PulD (secretin)
VRSSVHVEPATAPSVPATDPPPSVPILAAGKPAMSPLPERRIQLLEVPLGTPISVAVSQLASLLGMGAAIDPEVRGTTGATLRNITLDSALEELVGRRGYAFRIEGTTVRVDPLRLTTRTFHLDYVAMSRVGTMSIVVHRRLANYIARNPATASTSATGDDVLTSQSVGDVWQEIRVALTGLLQSGQAVSPRSTPIDSTSSAGSNGAIASNTTFANGSSLVISPLSGLISVTAMPDKLRDIESFINDFQASVLRQVLIEAKIVEVDLSNAFPFGIDWNVLTAGAPRFSLRRDETTLMSGDAGSSFALSGGSAQVDAVLNALAEQGTVRVLSSERATALNNQRAVFNVSTDEIVFYVAQTPLPKPGRGVTSIQIQVVPQQISVGVILDVMPQISADNVLTMSIRPAVTSIARVDSVTLADGTMTTAPVVSRREGDTIARLRAGQTMVIGGLVQNRSGSTVTGIRGLKDIPLIGRPFRRVTRTDIRSELVIFLTATVVSAPATAGAGGP